MIGRQVGTSILRLPRCARLPIRNPSQISHDLPIRSFAPLQQRFYAQTTPSRPGRPKKAVGEPSRPVKRSVKRAAKSPKEDAATQQVKARKESAQKKTKKAAGRTKKKKTLTPEEQVKAAEKKAKKKASTAKKRQQANIVELKKIALAPPHVRPLNAHQVYVSERSKELQGKGRRPDQMREEFAQLQKTMGEDWKNISAAEREHYNHLAHTQAEREQADYKRYVESHSAEEIEAANKARKTLRTRFKDKPLELKKWKPIKDERSVKRPTNVFALFSKSRHSSGDFRHIPVSESAKLIGQEWKALSEGEKQKYQNLFLQDKERYLEEYASVYGRLPTTSPPKRARAAAATA